MASKVVDAVTNQLPLPSFVKRRAAATLKARLAWSVLPLLGVGAAVWGISAWRRNKAMKHEPTQAQQLPLAETKAPKDKVDESSWESFPASDPPAASGGKIKPKPVPTNAKDTQ